MKTLVTAVDAATAENPSARKSSSNQASPQAASSPTPDGSPYEAPAPIAARFDGSTPKSTHTAAKTSAQTPSQASAQGGKAKQRLGREGKRFGGAVWEPFARLSGVLWLEVTGAFFGLFALVSLVHLWNLRAAWNTDTTPASRHSLISAGIMFLVFGYFCVSSFLRARRRERKR